MENNDNEFDTFDEEEYDDKYEMDFDIDYPEYCSDPELVKNRPDKSVLYINTTYPFTILDENVINFDEIKTIYLNINEDCFPDKTTNNWWVFEQYYKYNPDFYKTLIKFKNLETLYLIKVYLDKDYWIEIFDNLKCLKTLICTGDHNFGEFKVSNNIFQKIISMCELENLKFFQYNLNNFLEGPTNVKNLITEYCWFNNKFEIFKNLISWKKLEVISFNGRGYNVKISKKERKEAKELLRKNLPNIKYINLDGLLEEKIN